MGTFNDFAFKQRKYMPVFPKASGKPTIYIEGYPYEDDEPMPATEFHAEQVRNLYFWWEAQLDTQVGLLRPYLPDGTPITTSMEEHHLRIEAETRAAAAETRAQEMEAEIERLRRQLANRQDSDIS